MAFKAVVQIKCTPFYRNVVSQPDLFGVKFASLVGVMVKIDGILITIKTLNSRFVLAMEQIDYDGIISGEVIVPIRFHC